MTTTTDTQTPTDEHTREMILTRLLDAPRGLVFRAWLEQEQVGQWWGPNGFTTKTYEMDVRPGGVWRYDMVGPDGVVYPNKVTYEEINPVERVVYRHGAPDAAEDEFHTTVTFDAQEGKTLLTMRMLFPTVEALREAQSYGADEGGSQTIDKLEAFLRDKYTVNGEPKTKFVTDGRELTITRTFDAPRALVFEAFSKCEHLKHWWGPLGWELSICEMDFREGGSWRYCMSGPDNMNSYGLATYEAIVAPERVTYTDYFTDAQFTPMPEMPTIRNTVEFIEENGKTALVSRGTYNSADDVAQVMAMGMQEGLIETWDRLESYLATR